MFDRVVIDYGHGGMIDEKYQTPGGKQYHFTDPETLSIYEGVFNRGVASKLMTILSGFGIEVFDCTTTDRLHERNESCCPTNHLIVYKATSNQCSSQKAWKETHNFFLPRQQYFMLLALRWFPAEYTPVYRLQHKGEYNVITVQNKNLLTEIRECCLH